MLLACGALVGSVWLAGCARETVVPPMGFIPADVPLTAAAPDATSTSYRAPDVNLASYSRTFILPVVLYPGAVEAISPEDAVDVERRMTIALREAFAQRGPVLMGHAGATPPADALVVYCAITEIRPNRPLLNIAPQTQMRHRGYGYASVEMYVTAGPGGPVVAAYSDTANTQRFSAEKFTPMGTADEATRQWAQSLLQLVQK